MRSSRRLAHVPARSARALLLSTLTVLLAAVALTTAPAFAAEEVTGFEAPTTFGEFSFPRGAAVDNGSGTSKGDVYIADAEHHPGRVVKFNADGTSKLAELTYTPTLIEEEEGKKPLGVVFWDAVDPSTGDVYASNQGGGAVTRFSPEGAFISQITEASVTAAPAHAGFAPGGVAVDSSGRLYVADQANAVVDRLSSAGVYETQFADEATTAVTTIALDTSAGPNSGDLYVTDFGVAVKAFNAAAGTPVTPAGCASNVIDTAEPLGVAVDPLDGAVVVEEGGFAPTSHLMRYQTPCGPTPIEFGKEKFNEGSDGIAVSAIAPHAHDVYAVSNSGTIANLFHAEVQGAGPTQTLTVEKTGTGEGIVSSEPAGINCGATCSHAFPEGEEVTLTATPEAGSTFTEWSGACSGAGECKVTMSEAEEVEAQFTAVPSFSLTVEKTGTGEGTVSSEPAGISCGATCSHAFAEGEEVTLTASAAKGSTFTEWSGACSGAAECKVSMSEAREVKAQFTALPTFLLAVEKTGTGEGTVTSAPSGIQCGATCSHAFVEGEEVTLTATPEAGSTFSEWSGACSGAAECKVTISEAREVKALFAKAATFTLTVSTAGGGKVTSEPAGISCAPTCSAPFAAGTKVVLTEAAEPGFEFVGWIGCTPTGPTTCEAEVSAPTGVIAAFLKQAKEGKEGGEGGEGKEGAEGKEGKEGAPGGEGKEGKEGTKGTTGEKGAQGSAGAAGVAGTAGTAGAPGEKGAAGANGSSGKDGAAGPAGPAGAQGPAGAAGKIELVTCTTVKKNSKKVKHCTTKLVSGTVRFTANSALFTLRTSRTGIVTVAGQGLKTTSKVVAAGIHSMRVSLNAAGSRAQKRGGKIKVTIALKVGHRTASVSKTLEL